MKNYGGAGNAPTDEWLPVVEGTQFVGGAYNNLHSAMTYYALAEAVFLVTTGTMVPVPGTMVNLAIPHFLVSWKLYEDEKSLNALTEWRKTFAPRVKYIRKSLAEYDRELHPPTQLF